MTLYEKILAILTEVLGLIGCKPVEPINDDLGESESDYDDFLMQ